MISNIIKDIKMGFTLSKYGLKVKLQLGMAAFFFAIGVVVDIVSKGSSYIGGFYIILAGMFIFQCIISMDASTLIQSSGYKKKIQITYPYFAVIPLVVLFYTIMAIIHGIMANSPIGELTAAQSYDRQVAYLFSMNVLLFTTLVYFGICYKYFMIGMIVLLATVMPLTMLTANSEAWIVSHFSLSGVIIMGYAVLVIGFAISILLSNALYRKPLSKMAVRVDR